MPRNRINNEHNRRGGPKVASRGRTRQTDEVSKSPKPPVILAKPNAEKSKEPSLESDNEPKSGEKRQLLSRKESSKVEDSRSTDSPKSSSSNDNINPSSRVKDSSDSYVPIRNLKLIDDHVFCEPLFDYMSENTDFIVIGVIG